ncbi:MAG: ABC transporter substrate-binding protein, partial [Pseudomonas sp.]|nr:ABC transporter substrate-binding protein [Pseudomonas sp.]
MVLKGVLLALLMAAAPWAAAGDSQPGQIRLVSEEWVDYTNADGT